MTIPDEPHARLVALQQVVDRHIAITENPTDMQIDDVLERMYGATYKELATLLSPIATAFGVETIRKVGLPVIPQIVSAAAARELGAIMVGLVLAAEALMGIEL